MKLALCAVVALAAACFEDRYRCASDADCNLGQAGRCEADGLCTQFDPVCATQRSYSEHTGQQGVCFDGRVALANPCAAGQPPALPEGCAAEVCAVLPACCETGWSDACVQQAQQHCARCDTRLAVTATNATVSEVWQLDWDGSTWTPARRMDRRGPLAWVAPPPGELAPRLVGFGSEPGQLFVDDRALSVSADRVYRAIATVDVERSMRDTLALGFEGPSRGVELLVLSAPDAVVRRDIPTTAVDALSWADTDRDAFPDAVAAQNARYTLMQNIEGDDRARVLSTTSNSNMGDPSDGTPPLRRVDWLDLDRDGSLDLALFGSQIRMHVAAGALADTPFQALDCDPPTLLGSCAVERPTTYAGAALPGDPPTLIAAPQPARKVYRLAITRNRAPEVTTLVDPCPACEPVLAVVVRDLDGDRALDVIALDARLRLYTGLAKDDYALVEQPIAPRPATFVSVDVSVGGAPIP